jgi:hypothetical protein
MTWVYFTIHAAMAVKVWFGKFRVNQRFLEGVFSKLIKTGKSL